MLSAPETRHVEALHVCGVSELWCSGPIKVQQLIMPYVSVLAQHHQQNPNHIAPSYQHQISNQTKSTSKSWRDCLVQCVFLSSYWDPSLQLKARMKCTVEDVMAVLRFRGNVTKPLSPQKPYLGILLRLDIGWYNREVCLRAFSVYIRPLTPRRWLKSLSEYLAGPFLLPGHSSTISNYLNPTFHRLWHHR